MIPLEDAISNYGKIVYRIRENNPHQIYVVSQVHRRPDGTQSEETPRVQMEIFRIGQELMKNFGIELILYEGYAADTVYSKPANREAHVSDDEIVKRISEDPNLTLSSIHFFAETTQANIQGAEDRQINNARGRLLIPSDNWNNKKFSRYESLLLEYLHHLTTFAILRNTPHISQRELQTGRVSNLNALIIFGDRHIDKLIKSVDEDRFFLPAIYPYDTIDESLRLTELEYGVTVIRPNSIVDKDYHYFMNDIKTNKLNIIVW